MRELPNYWLLCWRAVAKRWLTLVAGAAGVLTLALLAATRPSLSDGRSAMILAQSAARRHLARSRAPVIDRVHQRATRRGCSRGLGDATLPAGGPLRRLLEPA